MNQKFSFASYGDLYLDSVFCYNNFFEQHALLNDSAGSICHILVTDMATLVVRGHDSRFLLQVTVLIFRLCLKNLAFLFYFHLLSN